MCCISIIQLFTLYARYYHFNTDNKYFEYNICSFHKKAYLCTAIKAGSVEQRPSKAWVLRSNRNGITNKRQVVDKTACLLLFLEGENIQLNGAVESPWGFCLM